MPYLIGIDIGTSGTKAILVQNNKVVTSHTAEYRMYQPQNGYAEQNPNDWWQAVCITLKTIIAGIDTNEIAGIGLSGQMHSLVLLDENNNVIRPAILWCDQRTATECEEIESIIGREKLIEITANPALPGFTASKLMWIKKHEPENYKKCRHILLPKDYIRFKLTGEYATDVSDASGMQLTDVKNRCWSNEVLNALDIDKSLVARLYESCEISGYVTKDAADKTGLKAGIPVAAGAGDNAAAAIGTGIVSDGKAFVTIGTSGVVFAHTDKPIIDTKGRIHTFCCAVPGKWHVMGVTQAAGLSLKWFKENFCNHLSYKEIDSLAEEKPIGADKLIYLPYLMGERTPHLDADARGVFFGLNAAHDTGNMSRAVMEGVSYSLKDCLKVINEVGINPKDITICGGGGNSPLWVGMLADIFNRNIKSITLTEGAALGAAILGGVCAGVYKDINEACEKIIETKTLVTPDIQNHAIYEKYYKIYKELYLSLKDIYKKIR